MEIFDRIKIGEPIPPVRYNAYYIVGYPLDLIANIFHTNKDVLFFWFNYIVLFGIGLSLFYILKNLINLATGLLTLLIPIFASYSILLLFYSGVIFNLINICIILPFAIYFMIKYIQTIKAKYAVGSVLMFALFSIFHITGIYLSFMVIGGLFLYVLYVWRTKQRITKKYLIIGSLLVIFSVGMFILKNRISLGVESIMVGGNSNASGSIMVGINPSANESIKGFPLIEQTFMYYLSPMVLAVIILCFIRIFNLYKKINNIEKLLIIIFLLLSLTMLPAMFGIFSPIPLVQGLDFAVFFSILATILVGIILRMDKNIVIPVILIVLIGFGSFQNIYKVTVGYNSALTNPDIEAIEYVNSLTADSFSVTKNIDMSIYKRYVNKPFKSSDAAILIDRNELMSSGGTSYLKLTPQDSEYFKVIKTFSEGDVVVTVYGDENIGVIK
jgi:hypothetical protein